MFDLFQAKSMIAGLRGMYSGLLIEIHKILKVKGRVAIIVPRFKTIEGKTVQMGFSELANGSGYRVLNGPILYAYKESKLIREIYVIEKT